MKINDIQSGQITECMCNTFDNHSTALITAKVFDFDLSGPLCLFLFQLFEILFRIHLCTALELCIFTEFDVYIASIASIAFSNPTMSSSKKRPFPCLHER